MPLRSPTRRAARFVLVLLLALATGLVAARAPEQAAAFWVARWPGAERVLLDADAVAAQNAAMHASDPAIQPLDALPESMPAERVRERIQAMSRPANAPRFFADGRAVDAAAYRRWQAALDLDAVADPTPLRFALVTRRAPLRTYPTAERVLAAPDEHDLDRFQESAFFPGTPVVVLHTSADGAWCFVVGETYAAWFPADALAFGAREAVLGYDARATRVITGARASLVSTRESPAASGRALDMGVALPERRDALVENEVNGQAPLAAHVIELPVRQLDGTLHLHPALLPAGADSHDGPLPASRENVLRQAFKFLGERYGWGHDFDGRDCSGFVAEVYRSLGLLLPRNTGDQARSPVLARTPLEGWNREQRAAAVGAMAPGDLLYLPGHVVMLVGHDDQGPWVIHDVYRIRRREGDGLREVRVNSVAVMPLRPLQFDETRDYLDAATAIVRVLPRDDTAP